MSSMLLYTEIALPHKRYFTDFRGVARISLQKGKRYGI